jgi:TRAP-type C4-dicarboxylate transport system permease small subunit
MRLRRIARVGLKAVGLLETALAVSILVTIVLIILSQVFSRYVMGTPLIWAEELATYLLIWLAFVTASVALKLKRHITIRTYEGFAGPRALDWANAAVYLIVAGALLAVILHVPAAMRTEMMQSTVGLPINVGKHWFFSVPVLIFSISMLVTTVFYIVDSLTGNRDPILMMPTDPSLDDAIGLEDFPITASQRGAGK